MRKIEFTMSFFLVILLSLMFFPKIIISLLVVSGFLLATPVVLFGAIICYLIYKSKRRHGHHRPKRHAHQQPPRAQHKNSSMDDTEDIPRNGSHETITLSESDYKVVDKKK